MQCKKIKKNGEQCKNHGAYGCRTCRYHGARRIRYGKEAPNYKNGSRTKEAMETRKRLRLLHHLGNLGGFIKRKLRGRKILIQGEKI
jgi:hypothetical protein